MKKLLLLASILLASVPSFAGEPKVHWKLVKSELTYTVTHPLHVVHGKSLSARGEGIGYSDGTAQFLVAVPVQSFDSGDNNRDLHMQEVTKAGLYPLIKVHVNIGNMSFKPLKQKLLGEVTIDFAGKKVQYHQVELEVLDWKANQAHITGVLPLSLKDFDIKPPALLTVPIHEEVPVNLELWWNQSE